MKPLVAIVGRPNVGKSTLFNRLARRRIALVEDIPGVTRDRQYWDVEYEGRDLTIIDTGGFVPGEKDSLLQQVREQAQLAVEECDAIIFVTDARAGLTAADQEVATYLRQSGKPVVVAANKLDSESQTVQAHASEFFKLGLGDVFPISAEHGLGVGSMMETVVGKLPPLSEEELEARKKAAEAEERAERGEEGEEEAPAEEEEERPIRVAIIGRPNVGKSTLVNALLKEKRVVASEVPGTTRDPIDSELTYKERQVILTDTAGIRRKKTIAHRVEKFSVVAALKAMERSDVAVLLMDATEPAVDQDAKLAGIAEEKGRALVIVVNKWDLISTDQRKQEIFREELKHSLKFVGYAPIVFTSALTGAKVEKVLELAVELAVQFRYRAPTPQLNRLLEHISENHPAPIVGRGPLRVYYIAQVGTAPPAFALTCNRPDGVPDMYKRYITNQLRKTFDLRVPIRLFFRERPGKAKREARRRPKLAGKH
ncbi:ribosome biogenesis GTPase Der [Vitiosangium sp. GDMCC 1.1324]|uniref:ribosome biogenesis GTPase Der n=1 Tax=Vitiosangium sp. (strain GDMCC 1.1324) TaxID=2138576 RepID=UPI000D36FC4F|nr:ribosome biogenesis GTPase Der [Vitiosangium sp. GDMCC 1.1324]PTL85880.1 ribosome biogenesis GTPase Der [Vitiosangium sp. GDMCC 1.1324]